MSLPFPCVRSSLTLSSLLGTNENISKSQTTSSFCSFSRTVLSACLGLIRPNHYLYTRSRYPRPAPAFFRSPKRPAWKANRLEDNPAIFSFPFASPRIEGWISQQGPRDSRTFFLPKTPNQGGALLIPSFIRFHLSTNPEAKRECGDTLGKDETGPGNVTYTYTLRVPAAAAASDLVGRKFTIDISSQLRQHHTFTHRTTPQPAYFDFLDVFDKI